MRNNKYYDENSLINSQEIWSWVTWFTTSEKFLPTGLCLCSMQLPFSKDNCYPYVVLIFALYFIICQRQYCIHLLNLFLFWGSANVTVQEILPLDCFFDLINIFPMFYVTIKLLTVGFQTYQYTTCAFHYLPYFWVLFLIYNFCYRFLIFKMFLSNSMINSLIELRETDVTSLLQGNYSSFIMPSYVFLNCVQDFSAGMDQYHLNTYQTKPHVLPYISISVWFSRYTL